MNKMSLTKALPMAAIAASALALQACAPADDTANDDTMMESSAMMAASEGMDEDGVMVGGAMMVPSKNIVANAAEADNVTTLVAAVQAAGLAETLSSEGPFTVFGPTDSAFAKLPAGTVENLVKPENKETLVNILTYHVVAGAYRASDITDGMTLETVQGGTLTFKVQDGKVWVNGAAMVETADVISSNGVTHVIDTVLMPQ